jgi:HAD superfamily hydrolase (TIGR01509 family)
MPLKAVLFDFDGVIADTENQHIAAWQRTLGIMGWLVPDEIAAQSAEVEDREFLRKLFADRGLPVDKVEDWVRRKQALTVQLLRDSPRLYPGVVELVRALEGKIPLAIVSDTWRENIQAVLESAGLTAAFETIVAKEDVTRAKSDPQSYLLALKRLRRSPRSVVAIEDSPSGLDAARAAGIPRIIAVGHRRPFGDWAYGATYISGFEPVEGLLKHLGL